MSKDTSSEDGPAKPIAISLQPITISFETKDDKPQPPKRWWTPEKADLIKWFFGTLVLGGVGLWINSTVQKTQLEINRKVQDTQLEVNRMEADSKLISSVSVKYSRSTDEQIAYLNYIRPFITSDSIRESVRRTMAALQVQLKQEQEEELKKAAQKREKENMTVPTPEDRKKASTKPSVPQPNEQYDRTEGLDTAVIRTIEKIKENIVPLTENNYVLQGSPETKWCKDGYYVEFNGTLRIIVDDVGDGKAFVTIRSLREANKPVIGDNSNVSIKEGEIKQVDEGEFRYRISLDYIGRAGRNPLTRAAYLTVSTYKKG